MTLTSEAIQGQETLFDIQGALATPATGCQIIVREKEHTTNKSGPLNVHVFAPRVVDFQMYLSSNAPVPPATAYPSALGAVPAQDIIKSELNTTYREQANITFNMVNPAATVMDHIGGGIFDASSGNVSEARAQALVDTVSSANHLRIFVVKSLVPISGVDHDGLAGIGNNWAIVEASAPTSVYSHETGHALDLTKKALGDGTHHEGNGVRAPNGGFPLMAPGSASTRWIRQEDWRAANLQAAKTIYRQ